MAKKFDLNTFMQGIQDGRDEVNKAIWVSHIEGQTDNHEELSKWFSLILKNAIENILRKQFPANYEAMTNQALELLEDYSHIQVGDLGDDDPNTIAVHPYLVEAIAAEYGEEQCQEM